MQVASGAAGGEPGAALTLVQRLWALFQARRWDEAQALFKPAAYCHWWASRERLSGAAAIIHVNAVYPEGWTLHLLELQALADGRVLSLVRVDQGGTSFYATSFFQMEAGLIAGVDEYWADCQPAPDWRRDGRLPGLEPLPEDRRPGLSLAC